MSSSLKGLGTKRNRRGTPTLLLFSLLLIFAAIGLFVVELITFSQGEERLPADITVAGIQVGGLPANEAITKWEKAYAQPLDVYFQDQHGNHPIRLFPDSINFRLKSQAMVAQARASGETGGGFWPRFVNHIMGQTNEQQIDIPIQAEYQTTRVEEFLRDIERRYNKAPGQAGFDVQTLTTFDRSDGVALDFEAGMAVIDEALKNPENRSVLLPVTGVSRSGNQTLDDLKELIIRYLASQGFDYDGASTIASVFILDLTTGEELNILGDVAFSAASTMKAPILIDYYRALTFTPTPEEAWLMVNSLLCSNNSSSNLIMQIVGENDLFRGIASVTNTAQSLGAKNTFITAPFYLGIEGQQLGSIPAPQTSPNPDFDTDPDPFNQTTAEDLGTLFAMIYDCANYGSGLMAAYPNGEFNQTECRQMLEIMSANNLQRLLQAGIPRGTRISHKNGWVGEIAGDAGIVFPPNGNDYVISVFLWEKTPSDFQNYEELWPLIEEISRAAWNHFVPENPLLTPRTDLPITAEPCDEGENRYLPPSPEQVNLNNINSWKTQSGN